MRIFDQAGRFSEEDVLAANQAIQADWRSWSGVAVVLAAGGRATNRVGQEYTFNQPDPLVDGVCATNGGVHDEVLALLAEPA
jgi:fructose-1,6-bisphosphatase/inositol monophosphatase family enzyme